MRKSALRTCASAVTLAVIALSSVPALAQDAAADAEAEAEQADQIVVTASGGDKSQLDSSVSVTSVSADLIEHSSPARKPKSSA